MEKMSEDQWEKRRKPIMLGIAALMVFFAIGSFAGLVALKKATAPQTSPYVSANVYSRLEFQAINTVQAMLSARPEDREILSDMLGGRSDLPNLNETPASVVAGSANVVNITPPVPVSENGVTYRSFVTVGISYSTAGSSEVMRGYFKTPFLIYPRENGPAVVTPESLPIAVKPDTRKIAASKQFNNNIPMDSTLGVVVDGFVKAYYGRAGAEALTRFTTQEFSLSPDREPLGESSMFSNVETLRILSSKAPNSLDQGESMPVFATLRLSNNAATFVNNEVYLTVKKQNGDHWLVDGFSTDYPGNGNPQLK